MPDSLVLVTGGSGFIAGHCVLQLLEQGHRVRTTVRSLARETSVRDVLTRAGMTRGDALEFVAADLTRDDGWADAMAGADAVLHVASPVAPGKVTDESEIIKPPIVGVPRLPRWLATKHRKPATSRVGPLRCSTIASPSTWPRWAW